MNKEEILTSKELIQFLRDNLTMEYRSVSAYEYAKVILKLNETPICETYLWDVK